MRKLLTPALLCAAIMGLGMTTQARAVPNPKIEADFQKVVDGYFDFYFQFHPSQGTAAGFHQYDSQLEDLSKSGVTAQIVGLKKFEAQFGQSSSAELSEQSQGDLEFLLSQIRSQLLELQEIQMWRKDPDSYSSTISNSIFVIMKRNYASQSDRLNAVIARERQIPTAIAAARANLKNPPKIYTEIALQQLPDTIDFFRNDVISAFPEVKDAKLLAEFKASNQAAVEALQQYESFLKSVILPASNGEFRLGAENFRRKLLYDEIVDIPLDHLLEIGYADLRQNQQRMKTLAAQIDPKLTAREILAEAQKDHPAAGQLLQSFRDVLESLQRFIAENKVGSIPSQVLPIVEETPPFARALTTAAMETPGAYETKATEGFLEVTLPDPKWKPEQSEEWMRGFNFYTIRITAIHEAFPGHFLQFLWQPAAPSKTRKLLYCSSNVEGWAHYTEQMMLDEGYGSGDPKLRLLQLQDALLRDARFIVGIQMHTQKMTVDQGKQFFIDEAYVVPQMADAEAKRGTSDPTYLVYTLGKLQILKLREDYRRQQGDKFSVKEFHDRFLQQGGLPLKIIRKTMLGNESPAL